MTLIKRTGGYVPLFSNFFDDFLTRDLFGDNWLSSSSTNTTIPKVNIRENDNEFLVEMAAPGMNKDDFKIELDNNILTISSEMSRDNEENYNEKFSRREFSYQSFRRSFNLPETVLVDKIQAKYKDGILNLVIPKTDETKKKPVRTIKIS